VDADLRRPRLDEYMGVVGAVGLTDALVGRVPLDDVLQPWGEDDLRVLPSGPAPPNPSELLGSRQMRELLSDLEARADLVLFDAPPLLPVTDAAVLASMCSGVIVVVRAGKTRREQAARTAEILRGVDAQIYGAVLNMIPVKGPNASQYGYYGYGYGPTGGGPAAGQAPPSRPVGETATRTTVLPRR
jgi:capsular exopolysaccharide synthesis family protein